MLKYLHANLSLQLFVFKEEGNITFGNESYGVQNGSIKMFIKVSIILSLINTKEYSFF